LLLDGILAQATKLIRPLLNSLYSILYPSSAVLYQINPLLNPSLGQIDSLVEAVLYCFGAVLYQIDSLLNALLGDIDATIEKIKPPLKEVLLLLDLGVQLVSQMGRFEAGRDCGEALGRRALLSLLHKFLCCLLGESGLLGLVLFVRFVGLCGGGGFFGF